MPESSKTSFLELSARFKSGGIDSIKQRYPEQKHFLLILSSEDNIPPVVWSSSNPTIVKGNTSITRSAAKESLKNYNFPNAIIQPIQKCSRNSHMPIVVGRNEEADIRLNSKKVSKLHCAFIINGNKLVFKDLQSRNGTYVNEDRFPPILMELQSGNELKFADVRAIYLTFDDLIEILNSK